MLLDFYFLTIWCTSLSKKGHFKKCISFHKFKRRSKYLFCAISECMYLKGRCFYLSVSGPFLAIIIFSFPSPPTGALSVPVVNWRKSLFCSSVNEWTISQNSLLRRKLNSIKTSREARRFKEHGCQQTSHVGYKHDG